MDEIDQFLLKKYSQGKIDAQDLPAGLLEKQVQSDPIKAGPQVGGTEASARGFFQGGTFGLADEATAGVKSLSNIPEAISSLSFDPIVDKYTEERDEERLYNKLAEEQHPGLYLAGNLAGGIASGMATGGLGAGIRGAAILGGVAGAGASNADNVTDLAKDTITGAALGGGIAGAGTAIGKGGKFVLDKTGNLGLNKVGQILENTDPGKLFMDSLKTGRKLDKNFIKTTEDKVTDFSKNTTKLLNEIEDKVSADKGKLIENSPDLIAVGGVRDVLEQDLNSLTQGNFGGTSSIAKTKGLASIKEDFGDTTQTVQKVIRGEPSVTQVKATPSARALLEEEIVKEKITANALGQNIRHEIKESVGPDGKKYLTKITTSDEPIGASEKLIPVKDDSGKVIDQILEKGDENFKTTAKAKTLEAVEGVPAQEITTPGKEKLVEETVTLPGGRIVRAKDANDLMKKLQTYGDNPDLQIAKNYFDKGAARIKKQLDEISGMQEVNKNVVKINKSKEALGIGTNFGAKDAASDTSKKQYLIAQSLFNQAKEGGFSTARDRALFRDSLRELKDISPESAMGVVQEIESTVPGLLKDIDLTSILQIPYSVVNPNFLINKAASPLGRLARGTAKVASPVVREALDAKPYKNAAIATGIQAAETNKNDLNTDALKTQVSKMNPDELVKLSQRFKGQSDLEGISTKLQKAAESNDPREKTQAEFLIQQNPNARQLLKNSN